jgi:hypothetical protein
MQEVILAKETSIRCDTHVISENILSGYLLSMAADTLWYGSANISPAYEGRQRIVNRSIAVKILRKRLLWHTDMRLYIYP